MARVVIFDPTGNELDFLTESLDSESFSVHVIREMQDFMLRIAEGEPDCLIVYLDGEAQPDSILRRITGSRALAEVPLLTILGSKASIDPHHAVQCGALQILHVPVDESVLNANVRGLIRDRRRLRILQDELRAREGSLGALREEVRQGRSVQESLLPPAMLKAEHFQLSSRLIPGGRLCGDYQDYRMLDERRLALLQADVSGNGFVTAMVASRIKAYFDDNIGQMQDPAAFLAELNSVMLNFGEHYQIATAVCLLVDLDASRVKIANAGHRTTYWYNRESGEHVEIPSSGPALGMFAEYEIDCVELPLGWESNRMVVFTDGLIEFKQDDNHWVSEEKFRDRVLGSGLAEPVESYCDRLIAESKQLTEHGAWRDDVSLVVLDFG